MKVFSLVLLTTAALAIVPQLAAQCTPQFNISVYSDGDSSSDGSTIYAYSTTEDSSILCTCVHSGYQAIAYLELANGTYVSNTESGETSSVSSATDGDGTYYAYGAATLNCSCAGTLGAGSPPGPITPPAPVITGIADTTSWSNTIYPGTSGYLAIFGTALTAWGQTPSPTVTGDGDISVSLYWASDTQVNVAYTVSANPAMGTHTILLQTKGGTGRGGVNAGCATPVNFRVSTPGHDIGGGALQFVYTWDSSTGNKNDLQACTLGEVVNYPSLSNPFPFPSPFPVSSYPNPTTNNVRGAAAGFSDTHSTPGTFITPYFANSFTASQQYQFQCTCSSSNAWQPISGFTGVSIVRSVSQNPPPAVTWNFLITKSGASATINPLP